MELRKEYALLGLIFFAVLGFRLFFALQTEHFDYEAYFNIRQVDSIRQTGLPIFVDPLSLGGRTVFFMPLYYYILAFFTLFASPLMVLKIVPNVFAASTVFIVFLLALEITKNRQAAVFSAFVSGFIPIFIYKTFNSVSLYALSIPLMFFVLYCLLKIENKIFIYPFIISFLVLTFIHPASLLLMICLVFYVVFILLEDIKHSRSEIELIIFSTLFVIWLNLLIFKRPLLFHGLAVVWQNTPALLLDSYFSELNLVDAVSKVGVVPFIAGIYVIYRYIFKEKRKSVYLFMSFALSVLIMLLLRLIQLDIGIMFLGVVLAVLFSQFYKLFFIYFEKTRFFNLKGLVVFCFFMVFVISSLWPSVSYVNKALLDEPSHKDVRALVWLKANTPENITLLVTPSEGYIVNAVAGRKTVIDQNFFLVRDVNQRFFDVNRIFTTQYEIEALRLLKRYDVDYIMFSHRARSSYKSDGLIYADDKDCFELAYNQPPIYKVKCGVEE